MKRFKPLLILLMVCVLLDLAGHLLAPLLVKSMNSYASASVQQDMDLIARARLVFQVLAVFAWLPVAIWVFRDSKKHMSLPWLWAFFIVLLHFKGVTIYFLVHLLTRENRVFAT